MSDTKSPKKLSRRQREEQRQMRRWMLMGGAAFGLVAAAGVGVTLMPPSFPELDGRETMDARLKAANISGHLLRLTPSLSKSDILIIGSTDCGFCVDFIKNGLADMVSFAVKAGMGVVYAPVGSSQTSLSSVRLLRCTSSASPADPIAILQSSYRAAESLKFGRSLEQVTSNSARELDLAPSAVKTCMDKDPLDAVGDMQALARQFPARGTPTFYVANATDPGKISWFSGWPGSSGLHRQIATARDAAQ